MSQWTDHANTFFTSVLLMFEVYGIDQDYHAMDADVAVYASVPLILRRLSSTPKLQLFPCTNCSFLLQDDYFPILISDIYPYIRHLLY